MATKTKKTEQSKKFAQAARDLECDESESAFDAALKKIGTAETTKKAK